LVKREALIMTVEITTLLLVFLVFIVDIWNGFNIIRIKERLNKKSIILSDKGVNNSSEENNKKDNKEKFS
jgi:hypothetical protein